MDGKRGSGDMSPGISFLHVHASFGRDLTACEVEGCIERQSKTQVNNKGAPKSHQCRCDLGAPSARLPAETSSGIAAVVRSCLTEQRERTNTTPNAPPHDPVASVELGTAACPWRCSQ
jgi:hypothetical protein